MKRKFISVVLTLLLAACLLLPASAAGWSRVYVPMTCWRCSCTGSGDCPTTLCVPNACEPSSKPEEVAAPTQPDTASRPQAPAEPSAPIAAEPAKPETPKAPAVGSSYEQRVVELVNAERAAYGLRALGISQKLTDGARVKSQDLHDRHYFDHNSPTYGTPFEMMRSFGITYAYAGENIAMGYSTPEAVVRAWMESPGHRANILSANFTSIGVGYVADGGYWTQWFLG